MSTTARTFDAALRAFLKSQTELMGLARECANLAISHFAEHGDTSYLQRLHDAFAKNFMRRVALVAWACEHGPIVFEGNKFTKDKRENAVAMNLEGALSVDFWDFKPEAVAEYYVGADIIEALQRALKAFEGGKRKIPTPDSDAETMLAAAKRAVSQLTHISASSEAATPASMN